MDRVVRDATETDLPVIMEIYNDAVVNTTAIWNDVLVDLDNRRDWFAARKARGFPVLTATIDGAVAGYASYGDWRAFDAIATRSSIRSMSTATFAAPASAGC